MDTPSLLLGAAFALLGAGRLALAGRGSRVCLVTLPAIGAVVTGAGLILLIARPILSQLGRSRWFRYHMGNIFRQKAASRE